MSQPLDIIGKTFNHLTVIAEAGHIHKGKRRALLCLCSCGKEVVIACPNLVHGGVKSCGCARIRKPVPIGSVFGRLTVIAESPRKNRSLTYLCRCSCGREKVITGGNLRSGSTKGCGCIRGERCKTILRTANTKHGFCTTKKKHPAYDCWSSMKERCRSPNSTGWENYGGRGIRVCRRWRESFPDFLEDLGERPSFGYTISRIDNDRNYSCGHCDECLASGWLSNCRWATWSEQAKNKRPRTVQSRLPKVPRACEHCGHTFLPRTKSHRFCSRACWADHGSTTTTSGE